MDKLFLVMPAYNEAANIEKAVRSWYPVLERAGEGSRLVVADSGSTDGTHRILVRLKKELPKLEILSDTGKQHGSKVIALYGHAVQEQADYIFQTDSDGQTEPGEFEGFWKLRNRYDAVLGKRPVRGDGRARKYIEKVLCRILYFYFRVSIPDANAPFRLMEAGLVRRYLGRMPKDYNLPNVMLAVYFVYFKEKVKFVDVKFKPRQGGKNSVNMVKIMKIGWKALRDFYMFRKSILNQRAEKKRERNDERFH